MGGATALKMATVVTALTGVLSLPPSIVTVTLTPARPPGDIGCSGHGTIGPYAMDAPGWSVGRITRSSAARICASRKLPPAGSPVTLTDRFAGTTPAGGSGTGVAGGGAPAVACVSGG